ncbi:hypothetical protein J4E82_008910 [Alternaria postmessia]|uniref:uncharacterized protein n=1 Tax=Alternaria postmessia TaxID=1187938 RepID=UPI002224769C|nr:uncharacterized protein J4E82_008910 [Alternaria postmessia]KAI5372364.1 hypothetical protein J4E82_008910 [Alternaria postmessia]
MLLQLLLVALTYRIGDAYAHLNQVVSPRGYLGSPKRNCGEETCLARRWHHRSHARRDAAAIYLIRHYRRSPAPLSSTNDVNEDQITYLTTTRSNLLHRTTARVAAHSYTPNGFIMLKGSTDNLLMAGCSARHYWHNA